MVAKQEPEIIDKAFLISELENTHNVASMLPYLQKMPTVEVAEVLEELEEFLMKKVFMLFSPEQQAYIFTDLSLDNQEFLFKSLEKKDIALILEHMNSAERADFFQSLEKEEQIMLLPFLNKATRDDVTHLSSYPPETAGGIMHSDFATVLSNHTVQEAINKIRIDSPSKKMIYYCYVVDENMRLQGFVTLKNLILAMPDELVMNVMHNEYVCAYVEDDREKVAQKIEKYDLVAIPIVNSHEQLVGIVTHDSAIEVIRAEHTEDLEKFMGITALTEDFDYEEISVGQHYKKRIPWLVVLLFFGILSGLVIQHFTYAIESIIVLALFMPMIAATGGNVGSQAASVIIRSMALGQLSSRDWVRVLWKESRTSFLVGISLGAVAFINALILISVSDISLDFSLFEIGFVIGLALSAQVISATMIGALLPLAVKKLGGDPAVVASPAITSFVDVTGLTIYFSIATAFFL